MNCIMLWLSSNPCPQSNDILISDGEYTEDDAMEKILLKTMSTKDPKKDVHIPKSWQKNLPTEIVSLLQIAKYTLKKIKVK